MDVIWTTPAERSLAEMIYYVRLRTGDVSARKVWQAIREHAELLSSNPFMGKIDPDLSSDKHEYRCIVVKKRSKVFYFIENNFLYIALVRDTRQDLSDLKDKLASLF